MPFLKINKNTFSNETDRISRYDRHVQIFTFQGIISMDLVFLFRSFNFFYYISHVSADRTDRIRP